MKNTIAKQISALTFSALIAFTVPAGADTEKNNADDHNHDHSHEKAEKEGKAETAHEHSSDDIYKGYFEDDQIQERLLSDWEGDWQSVYPLLQDGTLDEVMQHKAEHGEKTAEEYKAYYNIGYATDVNRILIEGNNATFFGKEGTVQGQYKNDGYEVLTYKAGNRGVRFIFEKESGDDAAPKYFQFSDHRIAPAAADHYHLYWGDDRAALLEEVTNWPTYYPAKLTGAEIVAEMLAH